VGVAEASTGESALMDTLEGCPGGSGFQAGDQGVDFCQLGVVGDEKALLVLAPQFDHQLEPLVEGEGMRHEREQSVLMQLVLNKGGLLGGVGFAKLLTYGCKSDSYLQSSAQVA